MYGFTAHPCTRVSPHRVSEDAGRSCESGREEEASREVGRPRASVCRVGWARENPRETLKFTAYEISTWTAGQRSKSLAEEPSPVEDKENAALVRAAKDRELAAWSKFDVSIPAKEGAPSKAVVDSRFVHAQKMVDGRGNMKTRLVPKGFHFK